jgi:hypothetical protein
MTTNEQEQLKRLAAAVVRQLAEDEDLVQELAEKFAKAQHKIVMDQLYKDLGRGLWGMCVRGLVMGIVAVACWGAAHSMGLIKWSH